MYLYIYISIYLFTYLPTYLPGLPTYLLTYLPTYLLTYLPTTYSFQFDSKIGPEGLLYDCGVELTAEGQYGQPDYHRHATRGTYSLHSLYLLLWANFGAFCFSLLTHPNSQSEIHGTIISKSQNIRHYCVSQVKRMWMYLKNNLSLSDEERSFFVTRCLMNIYEVRVRYVSLIVHIYVYLSFDVLLYM